MLGTAAAPLQYAFYLLVAKRERVDPNDDSASVPNQPTSDRCVLILLATIYALNIADTLVISILTAVSGLPRTFWQLAFAPHVRGRWRSW